MSDINIPEDLPFRIIEKELELEHDCRIEIVNELVNLYRQLIEAYEYAKDPRFVDFQSRMHKILMRKDVQTMLRKETRLDKKKKKSEKEVEMKTRSKKFRSRKTASMEADQMKISRKLSQIMDNREITDKGSVGKAVNNIVSQNTNLTERLEMRRRQSSLNSKSFITLSTNTHG